MYLGIGNAIDPSTGIKREMPWEYIEFIFCRDLYHCTPAEFREQDAETVLLHLEFFNIEKRLNKTLGIPYQQGMNQKR